jgi:hypothetical protein
MGHSRKYATVISSAAVAAEAPAINPEATARLAAIDFNFILFLLENYDFYN